MNFTKVSIAILLFAAMLVCSSAAQAATTCTNASVSGVYGISTVGTGLNGSSQPASSIYQITADGNGNVTGTATKSIDGMIVTFTFAGTYSVASNCTGTAIFTNQNGDIEHDNFVLDNANRGAFLIQTDAVHVQSSVAVAEGTARCSNAGVAHTFAAQLTGLVNGVGQVAFMGQLTLNAKLGTISGTASLSQNGTITSSVPVTGTYQINSDCTGSAVITPQGLSAMNVNVVIVNGGKELMVIETDANTIVTGSLQE